MGKAIRVGLTKKTRFDVFKRDGFQCQYCGETPPRVTLEVDHIVPVSQGGINVTHNLVTACFDCNRGKGAGSLTAIPQSFADQAERIKEKRAQLQAYERLLASIKRREELDVDALEGLFEGHFTNYSFTDSFKRSVVRFLQSFALSELCDWMDLACYKFPAEPDRATKYFCGICWAKIKGTDHGPR